MSIGDDGVYSLLDPRYIWGWGAKNGTGFSTKRRCMHAWVCIERGRRHQGVGGGAFSTGGDGGEERANQNWAFFMNHDLNDTPMDGREGCIFLFGIFFLGLDGGSRRFPSLTRTGMDSGGGGGGGGGWGSCQSFFVVLLVSASSEGCSFQQASRDIWTGSRAGYGGDFVQVLSTEAMVQRRGGEAGVMTSGWEERRE